MPAHTGRTPRCGAGRTARRCAPDEAKGQKEAERDASTFCGARGYNKVKVLISSAGNNTVYTLIYTCG